MECAIFILVFLLALFYLITQIVGTYRLYEFYKKTYLVSLSDLESANNIFKLLLLEMGLLYFVLIQLIPISFSLYANIYLYMLIYMFGLTVLYQVSNKSIKEIFYMNSLIIANNVLVFAFPTLIFILSNMVNF